MAPPPHSPVPGRRGYRSLVPPPEGCKGWPVATAEQEVVEPQDLDGGSKDKDAADATADAAETGEADAVACAAPPSLDAPAAEEQVELDDAAEPDVKAAPIKSDPHLKAARQGELAEMRKFDSQLDELLTFDEDILKRPGSTGALALYRASLMALDPMDDWRREAFQAVVEDNREKLARVLSESGLELDVKNSGGQTLLEEARLRRRWRTEGLLVELSEEAARGEQRDSTKPDSGTEIDSAAGGAAEVGVASES
mmetsp:Transcript_5100/g.8915  ORF Transcript_5100/g.8915 Transcript_5100/m.8915 type:complete len:254 (+) Transcript_5100:59-820(+)